MKTAREWSKEYWGAAWMVSDERAIEARDAEHRAELLKLQDDLLQGANREVMAAALIERLKGELAEAKRENAKFLHALEQSAIQIDGLDSLVDSLHPRAAVCLAHLPSDDDGWNDATRANYERQYGDGPPCTCAPPAPSPAESTPVLCEQHGREDCPRPDHAAPPDDIRERLERLEKLARSIESGACALWVAERDTRQRIGDDHERRLAALEAKGEPGTHAKGAKPPLDEMIAAFGEPTNRHAFVTGPLAASIWGEAVSAEQMCGICNNPDGPPWHPKGAKP